MYREKEEKKIGEIVNNVLSVGGIMRRRDSGAKDCKFYILYFFQKYYIIS